MAISKRWSTTNEATFNPFIQFFLYNDRCPTEEGFVPCSSLFPASATSDYVSLYRSFASSLVGLMQTSGYQLPTDLDIRSYQQGKLALLWSLSDRWAPIHCQHQLWIYVRLSILLLLLRLNMFGPETLHYARRFLLDAIPHMHQLEIHFYDVGVVSRILKEYNFSCSHVPLLDTGTPLQNLEKVITGKKSAPSPNPATALLETWVRRIALGDPPPKLALQLLKDHPNTKSSLSRVSKHPKKYSLLLGLACAVTSLSHLRPSYEAMTMSTQFAPLLARAIGQRFPHDAKIFDYINVWSDALVPYPRPQELIPDIVSDGTVYTVLLSTPPKHTTDALRDGLITILHAIWKGSSTDTQLMQLIGVGYRSSRLVRRFADATIYWKVSRLPWHPTSPLGDCILKTRHLLACRWGQSARFTDSPSETMTRWVLTSIREYIAYLLLRCPYRRIPPPHLERIEMANQTGNWLAGRWTDSPAPVYSTKSLTKEKTPTQLAMYILDKFHKVRIDEFILATVAHGKLPDRFQYIFDGERMKASFGHRWKKRLTSFLHTFPLDDIFSPGTCNRYEWQHRLMTVFRLSREDISLFARLAEPFHHEQKTPRNLIAHYIRRLSDRGRNLILNLLHLGLHTSRFVEAIPLPMKETIFQATLKHLRGGNCIPFGVLYCHPSCRHRGMCHGILNASGKPTIDITKRGFMCRAHQTHVKGEDESENSQSRKAPTDAQRYAYFAKRLKTDIQLILKELFPIADDFYFARKTLFGAIDDLSWMPRRRFRTAEAASGDAAAAGNAETAAGNAETAAGNAETAAAGSGQFPVSLLDLHHGWKPTPDIPRTARSLPVSRSRESIRKWVVTRTRGHPRFHSFLKKMCKWITKKHLPKLTDCRARFFQPIGYMYKLRFIRKDIVEYETYKLCPWCWEMKRLNGSNGAICEQYACNDCTLPKAKQDTFRPLLVMV